MSEIEDGADDSVGEGAILGRQVAVRSVRPNLEVSEVEESIRFFGDLLGLEVLNHQGDPAFFAILGLAADESPNTEVVAVVAMEDLAVADVTACYIEVEDLAPVLERITDHQIRVVQEPTDHPWGLRDVVVAHPDGHLIAIGERRG